MVLWPATTDKRNYQSNRANVQLLLSTDNNITLCINALQSLLLCQLELLLLFLFKGDRGIYPPLATW